MALKARSVLTVGLDQVYRTSGSDCGQVSTFGLWPELYGHTGPGWSAAESIQPVRELPGADVRTGVMPTSSGLAGGAEPFSYRAHLCQPSQPVVLVGPSLPF